MLALSDPLYEHLLLPLWSHEEVVAESRKMWAETVPHFGRAFAPGQQVVVLLDQKYRAVRLDQRTPAGAQEVVGTIAGGAFQPDYGGPTVPLRHDRSYVRAVLPPSDPALIDEWITGERRALLDAAQKLLWFRCGTERGVAVMISEAWLLAYTEPAVLDLTVDLSGRKTKPYRGPMARTPFDLQASALWDSSTTIATNLQRLSELANVGQFGLLSPTSP